MYAVLSVAFLVTSWVLVMRAPMTFGPGTLRAWGVLALAILMACASMQASEVRKRAQAKGRL